ncbi:MAG: tRNA 4-thiouridine(8) synthase ThiI [Treponema sp.]|jgi:thiamine biosynthesis protein ThiI|nr:tRNA 4-thiouridine(8) synthase ThiI [Treponema sp.]
METSDDTITYLLKLGELTLKGGNRAGFEIILKRNLAARFKGTGAQITTSNGRFYVRCSPGAGGRVEEVLDKIMGISGWARTRVSGKTREELLKALVETAGEWAQRGLETFKVEARRTDKSFPMDSYQIRKEGGQAILDSIPLLKVDVHNPQVLIEAEIREKAYVYGMEKKGRRGLPSGTAGRGLLLLSGGIDSPVAGYMMISRGMGIDSVYFHAYPYTSDEARKKVVRLAEIVGSYSMGMRLYTIGFTAVQMRIKEKAPLAWTTVLLRMAMMECAEKIAKMRRYKCLVSGESLSQVASQTIENISCTESRITIPVLRPLIGMDKEQIIRTAESIGTYETSILPYADCCVLFSPPHPVLRGNPEEAGALYEQLELPGLIEQAIREAAVEKCSYPATGNAPST